MTYYFQMRNSYRHIETKMNYHHVTFFSPQKKNAKWEVMLSFISNLLFFSFQIPKNVLCHALKVNGLIENGDSFDTSLSSSCQKIGVSKNELGFVVG